jgi:hypothetical protein
VRITIDAFNIVAVAVVAISIAVIIVANATRDTAYTGKHSASQRPGILRRG